MNSTESKRREVLIDFYRSCAMLFVFYHHTTAVFPGNVDLFPRFNPFAELFIAISGFMVGMVYLRKESYAPLVLRGGKMLAAYFVVSIPVAMGMAILGREREPLGPAIVDVLTFQSEPTAISILKFYGIMFVLLPLILPVFKRLKLLVLVLSAIVFLVATWLADTKSLNLQNAASIFLVFSLQAQFLLIFGTWLGQLHGSKLLIGNRFYLVMVLVFAFGLLVDAGLGFPSDVDRDPYNFHKLFNLLWTLPLLLLILWGAFSWMKDWPAMALVLNVGRNSLIAFLASEVVRQMVKLALLIFGLHPRIYGQTVVSLFTVVFVTLSLWLYQLYRQADIARKSRYFVEGAG